MEIPEWHETDLDPEQVVNLKAIAAMPGAPEYAALRSYATHRREHPLLGPMPRPVARIVNRRLWLRSEVEAWLTCPIPAWRRTKTAIARWIAQGRPRASTIVEPSSQVERARPTMVAHHGSGPTTPRC